VGSEMCIRDRQAGVGLGGLEHGGSGHAKQQHEQQAEN